MKVEVVVKSIQAHAAGEQPRHEPPTAKGNDNEELGEQEDRPAAPAKRYH